LHQAAREGHDAVIRQLLSYEAVSVNETDSGGLTPLHCAALYGHKSTITLLLRIPGVDIDAHDNDRATALCVAARENYWSVAWQILVEEPADINASCQSKKTALHYAVENGNMLLACVLVPLDLLDPNICDDHGWTSAMLHAKAICGCWRSC
jgi:ankyrin repeat protein